MAKYIFVTGGVLSSLGKGVASASIGLLLKSHGLKITNQKLDPYLNVDPGTMSPYQHGEVYVTYDGAETDLDLGHYERFTGNKTSQKSNWTAGRIYFEIITKERKGDYLGKTVQVIPHVTNMIKKAVYSLENNNDVIIVEIGGTVGDIESLPFLEAIRQIRQERGRENTLFIHLTLVPFINASGELKTKPTQHSVKELRAIGIQPDILLCRTDRFLTREIKEKISLFTNVPYEAVITAKDVDEIYEIPLIFKKGKLDKIILDALKLKSKRFNIEKWKKTVKILKNLKKDLTIYIVGKYVEYKDSYKSLSESLRLAGIPSKAKVNLNWIEAEDLENGETVDILKKADGILVPGGFGKRGIEGMIKAIKYARENNIPFLGICLGMQTATIEFARNVADLKKANSTEFDSKTPHKIFVKLKELKNVEELGGTMRLGEYLCKIKKDSDSYKAYKKSSFYERHRHRYEFNPEYEKTLENKGLFIAGKNPERGLVEIVEIKKHRWFVGCQFHPEFTTTPVSPNPLFVSFVKASLKYKEEKEKK
jgi:CTP synthase